MVISRGEDPHITFNSTTANKQAILYFNASNNDLRISMNGNTYILAVRKLIYSGAVTTEEAVTTPSDKIYVLCNDYTGGSDLYYISGYEVTKLTSGSHMGITLERDKIVGSSAAVSLYSIG